MKICEGTFARKWSTPPPVGLHYLNFDARSILSTKKDAHWIGAFKSKKSIDKIFIYFFVKGITWI